MGVHWKVGSAEGLLQAIPRRMDRFMAAAEDVVREVVERGAQWHREGIERIDTGLMRGSVGFEVPVSSGRVVSGEFGWTEEQELYFAVQEYGSEQFNTTIAPMHALTDAGSRARELLVSEIMKAIKEAWS